MPAVAERDITGRIAGSFRDPSGYVFLHRGRVFRTIDAECRDTLEHLSKSGVLPRLMKSGAVVDTHVVEERGLVAELESRHGPQAAFLEHDRIAHITYPYEWSISMVADAGIHTLDLQIALLEAGCSLKDATAYNIQFVGGLPRFIDLPSFERGRVSTSGTRSGQFQRMFVYPLLLGGITAGIHAGTSSPISMAAVPARWQAHSKDSRRTGQACCSTSRFRRSSKSAPPAVTGTERPSRRTARFPARRRRFRISSG